jgi:hypothetical protein
MTVRHALIVALCAAAASTAGGCAIIGWPVAAFSPPEKVPAEYKPPRGKTYLVFVDDILSPVTYEAVKGQITGELNERLETHGIASETVDYSDVVKLVSATPEFNRLSVSEVGRKLGADVVVYVEVNRFELREYENTSTWDGRMKVSVRVVDVAEQRRLWPEGRPAGFPVDEVSVPQVNLDMRDQSTRLSKMLAERTAERVIGLFVDRRKSR